ncbi:MAG: hypothetical protein K2Y42_06595 [Hyphomicrobium sp.]|jgi:hypothetical protein|uniref:hypothetical protein n=1 Tax=Hyphomicrobium sp. TaxID=82 RepID=UPI0025BA50AB|nr:hypothetical protein [Hyphomicrobium sp.]MBX9862407.1 hypothetical protein [Hyphomicrobium sp.]
MAVITSLIRWAFAILFGMVAVQVMATESFIGGAWILAGSILLSPPGGAALARAVSFFKSNTAQVLAAVAVIFVAFATTVAPRAPSTPAANPIPVASRFSCEHGVPADGAVVEVIGADSHPLRKKPNGETIVNEKATAIIGSTVYQSIDNSTKVQVQCRDGDWIRVQITDPDWLKHQVGWVQAGVLAFKLPGGQTREFAANDFHWDGDTSKAKAQIIKAVNRIRREDARCRDSISPASVAKSAHQSKVKGRPVFYVTCGDGIKVVTVYFDAARANDQKPFTAPSHLNRPQAIQLCEAYAKSQATHPSTVSFSRFLDIAVNEHANGRTTVLSSFTAKNSFNLELKFSIRCLLDENGFIEGVVNEAQ